MLTTSRVPHFPKEDTKLRATNLIRRRGGNTANALEVISQLLPDHNMNQETSTYSTELSLLTVLPDQTSSDTQEIIRSLPDVSPKLYQYRQGQPVAASSYIIQNTSNQTRTIVSANPLEELTVEEFTSAIAPLITPNMPKDEVWIHFEGRIPEVLLQCVQWLRANYGYHGKVKVSVECEKPDRTGMKDVAAFADVAFYSKIWAEVSGPSLPRLPSGFTSRCHNCETTFLQCSHLKAVLGAFSNSLMTHTMTDCFTRPASTPPYSHPPSPPPHFYALNSHTPTLTHSWFALGALTVPKLSARLTARSKKPRLSQAGGLHPTIPTRYNPSTL